MSAHAKFSPSHAATWSSCTASHVLEQKVGAKDRSSPAADEGTYAHSILEKCLLMGGTPYDWLPAERPADFPESVEVYDRDEMAEGVQVAVDYVNSRCVQMDNPKVLVEHKLDIFDECWGTADIILINGEFIQVIDFKYGKGVTVEVKDNPQLELYAIGAMNKYEGEFVTATIVQPRIKHTDGPVRSIPYEASKLRIRSTMYASRLRDIADGNTTFTPSEKACQWCRAKGGCHAFAEHSIKHMFGEVPMTNETIEQQAIRDPDVLSMEERTAILRNVELCRAWLKAVEAHSLEMALDGKPIDGFKVVEGGHSQRKWTLAEEEMLKKLRGMGMKVGDVTQQKLLGPAPVEKLAKRLKFSKIKQGNLQKMIVKPPGKKTLVPTSDSRTAIKLTADDMFGKPEEK